MTTVPPAQFDFPSGGEVPCTYHPAVMTRLRCSRCAKPICPKDAVRTPVGLRCPDCAGVRGLPTYRTSSTSMLAAAGAGLAVAVVVGIIWGFLPEWQFFMALLLGFGAVETMAYVTKNKRGLDLQISAIAIVAVGMVLSRVVLARRLGIPLDQINDLTPYGTSAMYLRLVPDLIYGIIPLAIAWYRFR